MSHSGLVHRLGKAAGWKRSREFESLHLRSVERSEKLRGEPSWELGVRDSKMLRA